jgi:prephenate dehydrogenase
MMFPMQHAAAPSPGPLPTDLPPALCVIGLGLIGGSLVRAMHDRLPVTGWSPSEETRAAAAGDGFDVVDTLDDALADAAERDALVVLASPVTTFAPLLRQIDEFAPTVRLTDVASVKSVVAEQVSNLAPRTRYVGSHPMAGTAQSGWRAGSPTLFDGAAWVTCLTEESDADDWADVAGVALAVGSRVVPAEPQAHDAAVARISHLPHIMALALAQVGEQGGALALSLAASSFADATRVAGTRPALVRAMCETNREALVDALDDALGIMGVARGSLASTGSLAKITQAGHLARARFDGRADELTAVTLEGAEMVDQLLAVGMAGGHVSGFERTPSGLAIKAWYPDQE